MGTQEIFKNHPKMGIHVKLFQIFKKGRSVSYFKMGIGSSVESFYSKFIVPRYLKYSRLKGQGYSCFSESNS